MYKYLQWSHITMAHINNREIEHNFTTIKAGPLNPTHNHDIQPPYRDLICKTGG